MKSAYIKDILRTIRHGRKRFLAIMIITILGVTMFSGLQAACEDLRWSADRFYKEQNLHDVCIQSTLGLTEDDVRELSALDGVETAEGGYAETITALIGDKSESISLRTLSPTGIDAPSIIEGRMPEASDEVVVTEKFLSDSGLKVGDSFEIEEDLDPGDEDTDPEEPTFANTTYTIVGSAVNVLSVDNPSGCTSFRSTVTSDETVFVPAEAADTDIYTFICLKMEGSDDLFCYGDAYQKKIDQLETEIKETLKDKREQARYDQVTGDAYEELEDKEKEVYDELDDAYQELLDGEETLAKELSDAEKELKDGETTLQKELSDAEQKLIDGQKELDDQLSAARQELEDGQAQLDSAQAQLDLGQAEYESGKAKAEQEFASARETIASKKELLAANQETLNEKQAELDAGYTQINEAYAKTEAGLTELEAGQARLDQGLVQVESGLDQLKESILQTRDGLSQLANEMETAQNSLETVNNSLAELEASHEEGSISEEEYQDRKTDLTGQAETLNGEITALSEKKDQLQATLSDLQARNEALLSQKAELDAQQETLTAKRTELETAKQTLDEKKSTLDAAQEQLNAGQAQLSAGQEELIAGENELNNKEAETYAQLSAAKAQLESGAAELESGKAELADGWAEYEEGKAEGEAKLADGWVEYEEGKAEGEAKLADGWKEYEEGKAEGEAELADGWKEYEDGKAEADEKFADARAEIEEIEYPTWYIWDRESLNGYKNIGSDADSIEAIATVFPIVFFIVAVMISLTTVTRMIEEDRGLVGTYKALGFSDREIRRKYLIYAGAASLAGSFIGTLAAFFLLPTIVCWIFATMYLLPSYCYVFVPLYGISGPFLFAGGILLATYLGCRTELVQTPASLMRPKTPRAGSRVFLERIPFIWNRLSFLNKVTARNLFRYKKRMIMTISGIAGCMALLLFGFAIKDSVDDLMPREYEQTFQYDMLTAVGTTDDNEKLLTYLEEDTGIRDYVNIEISTITLENEAEEDLSAQIIVVPGDSSLDSYVELRDLDGNILNLEDGDIYVTQNAGLVLDFDAGATINVRFNDLTEGTCKITSLVQNYLGNYLFMTEKTYEDTFGSFEPNGAMIHFDETVTDPKAFAEQFKKHEGIVTSCSTQGFKDEFSSAFLLILMVVYVIIIMSAALAFVVLFTLSTTNISERERELATIKVLGFFDHEVHLYVDKETYLLTGIGILVGIPLGYAFGQTLTSILNLPAIYLKASLHGISYLYAAGLTILFTIIVNIITDKSLNHIDPVEALKSVE